MKIKNTVTIITSLSLMLAALPAEAARDVYYDDYGEYSCFVPMNYTKYEEALQTAGVFSVNSSIALIRNAKRYVCPDHTGLKPQRINGKLHVTTDIARELFRACFEESAENNTVVLRNDDMENTVYSLNFIKTDDEHKLIPLESICEVFGMSIYSDGAITIIDTPERLSAIKADSGVLDYAKSIVENTSEISGRTFHVSQNNPKADDGNEGSESLPFKTINAAAAKAAAGDKIIVHTGTYRETVEFANSGIPGSPIIVEGAEGENVTVSGADVLEKLVKYKDGEYFAKIPNPMLYKNQVYINGEAYAEGRHPNTPNAEGRIVMSDYVELGRLWPTEGDITVTDRTTPYIMHSDELLNQVKQNYWKNAVWHGLLHEGWRTSASVVTSSREGSVKISDKIEPGGLSFGYWGGSEYEIPTDYGYLTDHVSTVDVPGEWVIKGNTLYIIMPEGKTPQNSTVEYKARQLLFDLSGKSNIIIKNITGFAGSVSMKDSELCMLTDCNFKYVSHFTWFADSREGYIDDRTDESENGAQTRGEVGLYIGGSDNVVKNCRIDTSAGAGLFLAGKYSYIYNNVLSECGYAGIMNAGIYIAFEPWQVDEDDYTKQGVFGGHSIYCNSVSKCGRSALAINSCYSWLLKKIPTRFAAMDIAYNDFYEGGIMSGRDGGIMYSYGTILGDDTIRTKIHNNLFWDYYAYDGFDCGMYFDAGTTDGEVFGNVVFYTKENADFEIACYNIDSVHQVMHKVKLFDWRNGTAMYIPGGKSALTSDDYPNGFVFESGSDMTDGGRTIPKNGANIKYMFNTAECSNGVNVKQNSVKPTANGDTAKFSSVNFGECTNAIELCFTGDYSAERDKLQLRLDSPDGKLFLSKSFKSGAGSTKQKDAVIIDINEISGIHDVYATFENVNTAEYISITPVNKNKGIKENNDKTSLLLECEKYDLRGKTGKYSVPWLIEALADGVNHTWRGTWMSFEGCYLRKSYNKIRVQYSTKGENSGNILQIMFDSPDSEPIAEFKLTGEDWNERIDLVCPVKSEITEGLHEVYAVFDGESYASSSNVYEIEFFID